MAENFLNMMRVPNKMNPKRLTQRHIVKMPTAKYKERILKVVRKKKLLVIYNGKPIRL